MIKKWGFFFVVLVLVKLSSSQIAVGDSAINFSLPDTAGNFLSLNDFQGDIILLNFFASWCPPCQVEAPQLEDSIWQPYRNQGVTVIGMDFQEPLPFVINFIREKGLTYPVVLDTAGEMFMAYGLSVFPSNVLINRDGRIVWVEAGFDIPRFVRLIDSLLNITSISDFPETGVVPEDFRIVSVSPNPFNSQAQLRVQLPTASELNLTVYDITGRELFTNQYRFAGGIQVIPIGMNAYASGVYFYKVTAGGESLVGRMVLQK